MGICLDLSHWDFATAGTLEHFRELAARDVSDVIIGGNPNFPDECQAQIQYSRDAGIYVGALYSFQFFGLDPARRWAHFNAGVAEQWKIGRVYIDCESEFYAPGDSRNTEAAGLTPADRIAELDGVLRALAAYDRAPGIYTNAWWRSKMADTSRYSTFPLWLAWWLSADSYAPYERFDGGGFGGWSVNAVHQFTSSYPGLIRDRRDANHIHDLEIWYMDVLGTIKTQGEEIARLNRLVAGYGYGRNADESKSIRLTGEAALKAADADGSSLFLGLGDTQADVEKLKSAEAEFLTIAPNVAADDAPGIH